MHACQDVSGVDLHFLTAAPTARLLAQVPTQRPPLVDAPARRPVPCAARPSTSFRHLDGPCQCFFGGPAPEFATL